jgi:molybdenum cofactor cytidylyltransferase
MGSVASILLAAGESARMGQPKALLPWERSTLLEYQIFSLSSSDIGRSMVVLGHHSEELIPLLSNRSNVKWVYNPDYLKGKTTSIKSGIRALGAIPEKALLILNVDQPRTPEVITAIVNEHLRSRSLITLPSYDGNGGHPMVISTSLLPELMAISEETKGLKAVTRRHEVDTHVMVMETAQILLDINTPEDYQIALEGTELA